jgi:hypothetical protein
MLMPLSKLKVMAEDERGLRSVCTIDLLPVTQRGGLGAREVETAIWELS